MYSLNIDSKIVYGIHILILRGKLSIESSTSLRDYIEENEAEGFKLILNFEKLIMIFDTGFTILISIMKKFDEKQYRLVFCCVDSDIRKRLEKLNIQYPKFDICKTEDDAIKTINQ